MPIMNGRYVSPTWLNNAPPAIDQTELQAITDTLAELDSGSGGGPGKRYANFVIGTSTNGWTTDDCDYLCDGIADNVEIQAAINALPSSGGEIKFLSGTYVISSPISINGSASFSLVMSGSGESSNLNFSSAGEYGITFRRGKCLKLFHLSISDLSRINHSRDSIFVSSNCFYNNSCIDNIGGVVLFYSNIFSVTRNLSGNFVLGGGISNYLLLSSNTFSCSSNVSSPNTIVSLGENGVAIGNRFQGNIERAIIGLNNSVICNNYCYNCGIFATFNSTVCGNVVSNGIIAASQSSITGNSIILGSIRGTEGCSICGNSIYQETPVNQSCIYITKARNNESETAFTVISGNTCDGGNIGIFLDTNSFNYKAQSHAVITGNACSSLVPLQIESNWSNCLITGNMFPNGAIVDNGSGNTKANNVTGA